MQRLALFDLDRTLVDLDAAFLQWSKEFAEQWRLGTDGVAWLASLNHDTHPHREAFFGQIREHFALPEDVDELWAAYRKRMPHLVRCYPGVPEALAELRAAGWRVGIVTNGMADNQLGKLQRTGLATAVDGYAVSGAEGVRKPEGRLFHIAAERCGVSLAKGGWMVGDNLIADVQGAQGVGLHAIWIDRGTWSGHDHRADHVVSDVLQSITIMHGAQTQE